MTKRYLTRVAAAAALAVSVAFGAQAADLKVGFVYIGPIGDHGWTISTIRVVLA